MSDSTDFSPLSASWLYWAGLAGLTNPQVSDARSDGEVRFTSEDFSFHLRHSGGWWTIDTVDDRGQLHTDTAKFTTFELAEKYLIWQWSSTARNVLRRPRLGPKLYSLGHNSNIQFIPIKEGIYELRTPDGRAVLMEPVATIFSHLIFKSADEIDQMVKEGIA
ncbi:hypothetical protein [Mycobacterium hubeiense]|uniref:hypothetical protein n=1 Tax=Mycobacterium hubeiense TaxID=1867256 RepID=UPI00115725AA|nr:hypothetical protein [Mycobacterium sp. QGD 101]